MNQSKILSCILVVVGLVLLALAWDSSRVVVDQVAEATSGRLTQSTIGYLIAGLAMVIGGGALWIGGRPRL